MVARRWLHEGMTTPAYITVADLQQLFSADEIAGYSANDGIDVLRLVALTNEEVHSYLAPLTRCEGQEVRAAKATESERVQSLVDQKIS